MDSAYYAEKLPRRSPHGERGLKFDVGVHDLHDLGRSPHGERGLKFFGMNWYGLVWMSLPAWGAWIEIIPGIHSAVQV